MALCRSSYHTANQRATDSLYYFSIGYYYYWIRFNLPILTTRVSRLSTSVVVRTQQ